MWPKTDETVKNSFISDLRVSIIFVIIIFLSVVYVVWSLVRVWSDMILVIDNRQIILTYL